MGIITKIKIFGFFFILAIFISVVIIFFPSFNISPNDIPSISIWIIYICFFGTIGLICLAILIIILYSLFIDPFISRIFLEIIYIIIIICFSWYIIIHLCYYFFKNWNNLRSSEFWGGFLDLKICLQSSSFCIGLLTFGNLDRTIDIKSGLNIFYFGERIRTFVKWIREKMMDLKKNMNSKKNMNPNDNNRI